LKRAASDRAEQGIKPSSSPIGYIYDKTKKKHVIDSDTKDMLNFIFDEYDKTDITTYKLADLANSKGYRFRTRLWTQSNVSELLLSPFYAGRFIHRKQEYQGNHEPYFDYERYLSRRKKMKLRQKFKPKVYDFLLSGLLYSLDSHKYTAELQRGHVYYYFRINRKRVYSIEENNLLDLIYDRIIYLAGLDWTPIRNILDSLIADAEGQTEDTGKKIQQEMLTLNRRVDKLYELYADSAIDPDTVKAKIIDYQNQIRQLENRKKEIPKVPVNISLDINKAIDNFSLIPALYSVLDDKGRSRILKKFVDKIILEPDSIQIQYKAPFKHIIDSFGNQTCNRE
jgi:hypothetical protein